MRSILSRYAVPLNVLVNAVVLAASAFAFHWEPGQIAAAQGLAIAIMGLLTYSSVASAATVAAVATQAAVKTAEKLTTDTVGTVDQITASGVQVARDAAQEVTEAVGGLVGGLAGGLAGASRR